MGFFGGPDHSVVSQLYFAVQLVVFCILAVHILFKKQDPVACLGWLLGAALFPILTSAAYVAFGINPFDGYRRRKQKSASILNAQKQLSSSEIRIVTQSQYESLNIRGFENTTEWLTQSTGQHLVMGDHIQMIINSDAAYKEYERAIAAATEYILVAFYQIQPDKVGMHFLDLLAEKAAQGLRVYALFDSLGSYGLTEDKLNQYREKGLKIHSFLPIRSSRRRLQVNWRNHRKIVVCDGKEAFIGGFNIGTMYLVGKDSKNPSWLDVNFLIRGAMIENLLTIFKEDWHFATNEMIRNLMVRASVNAASESLSTVIASGPSSEIPPFYSTLLSIFYEAKKRVWIATPYFVPDKALVQAMVHAAKRGIDIKLMVPMKSNHRFTDFCGKSFFSDLHRAGVKIYRFRSGVCHAKILIADDDLVMTGSSNLDYRSFFLNFEVDLFVRSRELMHQIVTFFEEARSKSSLLTKKEAHTRNPVKLFVMRIARLAAPLL